MRRLTLSDRLLKRRQIRGSRTCAVAVTHLLLRLVAESKYKTVVQALENIRGIGRRLIDAQPRELVVGNIVRRVLGLVREVSEVPADEGSALGQNTLNLMPSNGNAISGIETLQILTTSNTSSVEQRPEHAGPPTMREVKEDMLNGLREMLDELDQADEQISGYALEHIHVNEVILTYTSSLTVQKFLLGAAKRRAFSLIYVEGYSNLHEATHDTAINGRKREDDEDKSNDNRLKSLIAAGINVIIVPDSAVFAIMSRVHKVVLPAHVVLSNGGFIAASGSHVIAQAAKAHRVPVITLGAIYKHSPIYPFNVEEFIGLGDAGKSMDYREGDFVEHIDVINPICDYVAPNLADLVISNM